MRREEFTALFPNDDAFNYDSRIQKANKMSAILQDNLGDLSKFTCVDVGCSVGLITDYLARDFNKIVGVDVDTQALKVAKKHTNSKNVTYKVSKENSLPFKDSSVDVVIFSQIYEHAENPELLLNEIYRILKKGGVCFFGARNKYGGFYDGHYPNLPFISWLPKSISDKYTRLMTKKKEYDIVLYSYWQLKKLVKRFEIYDYTLAAIQNPKKYNAEDVIPTVMGVNKALYNIANMVYCFIPNYLWILEKRKN